MQLIGFLLSSRVQLPVPSPLLMQYIEKEALPVSANADEIRVLRRTEKRVCISKYCVLVIVKIISEDPYCFRL